MGTTTSSLFPNMTIACDIPTIDLQPWLDGSAPDQVVAQIRSACMTYGFFQLVGHGVPLSSQRQAFECAKRFFALPLDQKKSLTKNPLSGRGYEPMASQALQAGASPDQKEVCQLNISHDSEES